MYMSEESLKNVEEQALTSMQELFKAVSSVKEADTPTNPPGNSSSCDEEPVTEPGNGNQSDLNTHQAPHTGIYAIRSKSNFFSVFISSKIDANDIVGTIIMLSSMKVLLSFKRLAKKHYARRVTLFAK